MALQTESHEKEEIRRFHTGITLTDVVEIDPALLPESGLRDCAWEVEIIYLCIYTDTVARPPRNFLKTVGAASNIPMKIRSARRFAQPSISHELYNLCHFDYGQSLPIDPGLGCCRF